MIARRVLVVDDDPDMVHVIRTTLQDEGLLVETAADGREALVAVQDEPPELVVLDMTLPVVDGRGVAERLRQEHGQELPVLVITADGRAAAKARQVGAYAYLRKPFELDDLVDAVWRGLGDSDTRS
jgi:CheY-like chemotaxis protein